MGCLLVAVGTEVHGVLFGSNVHGPVHIKNPSNNTRLSLNVSEYYGL